MPLRVSSKPLSGENQIGRGHSECPWVSLDGFGLGLQPSKLTRPYHRTIIAPCGTCHPLPIIPLLVSPYLPIPLAAHPPMPLTPEQKARAEIDAQLAAAGWAVQDYRDIHIHSNLGDVLVQRESEFSRVGSYGVIAPPVLRTAGGPTPPWPC